MKICIIIYTLSLGGFTGSLIPMLKALSEKGIAVDLHIFEKSDVPVPKFPGLTVSYNQQPRDEWKKWALFVTNPYYIYRFLMSILAKKDQHHQMANWLQILCYLDISRYRPHDLTKYDCVLAWEEGFPSYYLSKIVQAKRKVSVFHTDYQIARMNQYIDRKGFRNIEKILTVSKATQSVLQEMLPCYRDKIGSFSNVLDVEKIIRMGEEPAETFEKGTFDLITVCRIENASKALDRLVRVSHRLKDDGFDFRWYLVGAGPFETELRALIAQAGLQDTILLLGAKANPHPFTKQADLFVLQSYYEGKSVSVAEALVLGVPVMISEYKSAHEQVTEGENGFIAENNEEAIYQKLRHLLSHKEEVLAVKEKLKAQDCSAFADPSALIAQLVE